MEVKINTIEDVTILEISGDIDGKTAPDLQGHILDRLELDDKILLDMSRVGFMSSAGLRVLLTTYRQATQNKSKVVLVGLSEEIRDMMSATGFLDFFTTSDSIKAGLQAI